MNTMVEGIVLKDQYNVMKEIGSGSFGKVYMVECIKTKERLAIKRINKKELEENEYLHQAFWKELDVMRKCECENSVRLVEHFLSSNFYNIVMELCDTDLDIVLNKRQRGFSEEEVKVLLKQLNIVFVIMERQNIIHRDLKLRNIMVVFNKEGEINLSNNYPLNFSSKLSDFGFSKVMDDDITRTKLGTPATMAPEILMNKNYSQKADLWSIGIITYQLLFKMLPFKARNEKELLNNILNNKGIKIPENYKISDTLHDLLKNLLQIDPKNRLSWKQYFEHPFFGNENIMISPSNFNIFEEKYINMRKLSDDFSEYKISKAKNKDTGEFVLIKEISRSIIDNDTNNKNIFHRELELLKTLKSEYFIKFIDFFQTRTHYYIVTEYFEGKILDNFLNNRKSLNEILVQQIIRNLAPAFKELDDKNIILDFISTKSFCFKFYKNEDNFKIKFFDYGLSIIFTTLNGQRDFLLNEAKSGKVIHQKTNVLSFGMVIYKLLFGENIYKFTLEEDPEITISKTKQIKLPKNISKSCKHLIMKTCHQNKDRRYDWKEFLDDSFVRIRYGEDIRVTSTKSENDSDNIINDYKVENLAENLKYKSEVIINYYENIFNQNEIELNNSNYSKFFKEMSIFTMLMVLEIKLFLEFLKPKETFFEDEELHLLKINQSEYEYCFCNFQKHKIIINKENPMIENYLKIFSNLEMQLLQIIGEILKKIDVNVDEVQSYDYLASSIRNYYSANIEKYFFSVFENGIINYSKSDMKEALNEFLISKYFYESIIFIRLIASNKPETTNFFKLFESIENDDEINLFSNENNAKKKELSINPQNLIIFTFLGGIIKTFKAHKIIEEDISSESLVQASQDSFESLIKFYPEIVKMILECSKKAESK